ncbi:MAG: heavy-metal-associated domain-containing protein, partial [Flavobacteriales bacterium]
VPAVDAVIVNNLGSNASSNVQAVLSIEGMMCEIACAGKIRKDLSSLEGVSLVEISYKADNPVDIAKVNYNAKLVSETDLINCVQKIADGELYHVSKLEVNELSSNEGTQTSGSSDGSTNLNIDFKMPGLWDVIRYFIPV